MTTSVFALIFNIFGKTHVNLANKVIQNKAELCTQLDIKKITINFFPVTRF